MKFLIRFQVYCDMVSVDQAWTLLARFSNRDTKNWMDDSGDWWYDSTQAAGETADPSYNADMISPAFWLVSGSELKITRNDDWTYSFIANNRKLFERADIPLQSYQLR